MTVSIQYLEEIIHEPSDAGIENVLVAFIKLHPGNTENILPLPWESKHCPRDARLKIVKRKLNNFACGDHSKPSLISNYFFFARFGLKVSSHKFTQFLPSKPLFVSRNASHQYDLHDRLRKCYTANLWSVIIARFVNELFIGSCRVQYKEFRVI